MAYEFLTATGEAALVDKLVPHFTGIQQEALVRFGDKVADLAVDSVWDDIENFYDFVTDIQGVGGAGMVGIADVGGYFTGVNVEAALQELGARPSGVSDHGALTGLADDDHTQYYNQARGDARYSQLGHTHTFASITSKPTTLSGYGITDAVSSAAFTWANLGSKPTTVSGFGITDAVTTTGAQSVAGVKTFTDAPVLPHATAFNGVAGTARRFRWTTSLALRWDMGASGDAESGANAGTNLVLNRYDDAGTFLGAVWSITRSTGVVNYTSTPTVGGVAVSLSTHTHDGSAITTGTIADARLPTTMAGKTLSSPSLTGTPTAPTATAGTNTTQIATTAYVQTELGSKANLASPAFTGTPTAPTAAAGTNTTQVATTEFVVTALRTISPTTQNGAYTFVAADGGRARVKNDTSAYTYTVNNSVHAAGDTLMVVNDSSTGNITIAQGSGVTLYLAGTTTTGNRTLAPRGTATIYMVSASVGYVSGPGVT